MILLHYSAVFNKIILTNNNLNLKVFLEIIKPQQLSNLDKPNLLLLCSVVQNLFLDNKLQPSVPHNLNLILERSSRNLYLAENSKKEAVFFQPTQTLQVYLAHNQMGKICQQEEDYFQGVFHKEVAYFKTSLKIYQVEYLQTKIKIFFKKTNKNKKTMMKMKAIRMKMNFQQFCWIMSLKLMILLKN